MKETEPVREYMANRIKGWADSGADRDSAEEWYNNLLVNLRDEYQLSEEDVHELDVFFGEFFPSEH